MAEEQQPPRLPQPIAQARPADVILIGETSPAVIAEVITEGENVAPTEGIGFTPRPAGTRPGGRRGRRGGRRRRKDGGRSPSNDNKPAEFSGDFSTEADAHDDEYSSEPAVISHASSVATESTGVIFSAPPAATPRDPPLTNESTGNEDLSTVSGIEKPGGGLPPYPPRSNSYRPRPESASVESAPIERNVEATPVAPPRTNVGNDIVAAGNIKDSSNVE